MDWKTIGIPLAAVVFAVLLGVKFLRPATSPEDRAAVEKLTNQYADLDSRMGKLEKTIASLSKDVERAVKLGESAARRPDPPFVAGTPPDPPTGSKELARTPPPLPPLGKPPGMPGSGQGLSKGLPTAWMDNLSEDKRKEVSAAFGRHAQAVRDAFPGGQDGRRMNPEELRTIMEEHDLALKSELKGILSEEEYTAFLSSLPSPPQPRPGFQERGLKPSSEQK